MAFVLSDRVRETSTAPGTGSFTVNGAVQGAQSFASVLTSNGDTTWYAATNGTAWETGLLTRTSATVYARTTIFASSNGGSAVNFASGTVDVFVDIPASRLIVAVKIQTFTSSGTYTPSPGMLYAIIEAVGGGGGGGGCVGSGTGTGMASGGGGGGYSRSIKSAAQVGASQAVTIGAGGAGGAAGANAGAAAGNTSVGALVAANGGGGGGFQNGTNTSGGGVGGPAGTGDVAVPGQAGTGGFGATITTVVPNNGNGGNSRFGSGGIGALNLPGAAASGNGAGGGPGGSYATATDRAGGNGSAGIVVITEYCSR